MLPGDEDEPTQDSLEVTRARFASNIVNATGIAVRNSRATEVVFVAPVPLLAHLHPHLDELLRLGAEPVEVPMDPEIWMSATGRRGLAGLEPAAGLPMPMLA